MYVIDADYVQSILFFLRLLISSIMYLILLSWHFNFLPRFTYQQTFQRHTVHTPSCFHFNHIHLLLFNWHLISFQCSHCDRHFQTFQVFASKQQPAHTTFTVCIWFTSTFFQNFFQGFLFISAMHWLTFQPLWVLSIQQIFFDTSTSFSSHT